MNRQAYLSRIGMAGAEMSIDETTLKLLQRKHLLAVPFENLDIHWKRPIILDTAGFYEKIVDKKRGGFCYELNGSFDELLRDIGFQTRIISARVGDRNGNYGPEYDHEAIIVTIGETEYLADVGFGAFAAEPLRFVPDIEQQDTAGVFVIRQSTDGYYEVARKDAGGWRAEYIFKSEAHELSEFAERCDFQQYSPDSHFLKGKICSLMTEDGRKTLTDKSFIVTRKEEKKETPIGTEEEFARVLFDEFGISRN